MDDVSHSVFLKGAFGELSLRLHFSCMCPFGQEMEYSPLELGSQGLWPRCNQSPWCVGPPTSSAEPLPGPVTRGSR